ncbi:sigma-70 family RNA polymerase sigma factor [Pseudonocardia parietis]|uniref:RNA polymerase sigma-70 factor (ECF subfamily) n=1 Tax=Pseudonocardia parietis TaxID=570936 RepID=A0ABS4VM79_9PSEU|nr:sigma-70 family RNA polymerase sigma factor [Pseudonocardia parietis]MBP2364853.1 RNA polymerase sigma-70 factor (ECF subfamily) [Pseudonocardia parietis]
MTALDRIPVPGAPDLDEVFRRHADRLWSVALRMLGDAAEAEDAVQEAFLAALRSPGFRGDATAGTWLHRIIVNGCVDRIRAAGRRRSHTRSLAPAVAADPAGRLVTRLAVDDALAVLPVEQRVAVVLVDGLGYSVSEVADIVGVPAGTVKSRCARGRLRLARALGHLREEGR